MDPNKSENECGGDETPGDEAATVKRERSGPDPIVHGAHLGRPAQPTRYRQPSASPELDDTAGPTTTSDDSRPED